MRVIEMLTQGPAASRVHLLLAHGAGAPMTSPFMELMSGLIAARGICVSRFEFPYMADRRTTGRRAPPPKAERLIGEFTAAVEHVKHGLTPGQKLVIGGKSMGGRVASMSAQMHFDRGDIAGLVCLGYPFHPPGKPDRLRISHLAQLTAPALIVQGARDPFGSRDEIDALQASSGFAPGIQISWAADGDHDLGPRGRSGFTRRGNLETAANAVADFCERLDGGAACGDRRASETR